MEKDALPLEIPARGQVIEAEMFYLGGLINAEYLYSAEILDNLLVLLLCYALCLIYLADTLKSTTLS